MRTLCRRNKFHVKHDGFHVPHPSTKRCVYMCIFFFFHLCSSICCSLFFFSVSRSPFCLSLFYWYRFNRPTEAEKKNKRTHHIWNKESKHNNTEACYCSFTVTIFFFFYLVCLFSLVAAFIQCTRNIYTDAKSVRFFFSLQYFNIFGSFEKAESINCPINDYLTQRRWMENTATTEIGQETTPTHLLPTQSKLWTPFKHILIFGFAVHSASFSRFISFCFLCCSGATVCK